MQSRAPLMIEHRLIERMLAVARRALADIRAGGRVEPDLVERVVDFIRTYADRTHHGKEEDILFARLEGLPLAAEDRRVMEELVAEHVFGRQTTQALARALELHRAGSPGALEEIAKNIEILAGFYPAHIAKEDKVFFPAARAYFTEAEDQALLDEYWEFDRKMIHEKYQALVQALEEGE